MATAGKLDRRAKAALIGLLLVLALILVLTVRSAIVAVTPDSLIAAPTPANQDEIMQVGNQTILLRHGSVGNKIAHWLHGGSKGSRAFEVSDAVFVTDSDVLTSEGEKRVGLFAEMMNHSDALKARILVSAPEENANLAQLRAERLRAALIKADIPSSRLDVSAEPIKGGADPSRHPQLVVVLST